MFLDRLLQRTPTPSLQRRPTTSRRGIRRLIQVCEDFLELAADAGDGNVLRSKAKSFTPRPDYIRRYITAKTYLSTVV
jgi:hypothetical protein